MATDISTNAIHGRDELLALAERRIAAVREGQGHLLLLSGEAGIGKTRLLQAMHGLADGFTLWGAGAFPQDVELSAGLLLDLGYAMSRSADADVADRGRALVSDLVGITEPVDDPGDAHRRRRLLVLDAADRLASLADDGPALLALEDLHWCDELSLEVVGHLARRLPSLPLLVVGTLRTDELHQDDTGAGVAVPAAPAAHGGGGPARPAWTWPTPPGWCRSCCPSGHPSADAGRPWCTSGRAACRCTSRSS